MCFYFSIFSVLFLFLLMFKKYYVDSFYLLFVKIIVSQPITLLGFWILNYHNLKSKVLCGLWFSFHIFEMFYTQKQFPSIHIFINYILFQFMIYPWNFSFDYFLQITMKVQFHFASIYVFGIYLWNLYLSTSIRVQSYLSSVKYIFVRYRMLVVWFSLTTKYQLSLKTWRRQIKKSFYLIIKLY